MPASDIFASDFKEAPFWWDSADPARQTWRRHDMPNAVDVVVVGGGLTGLSCALELARSGVTVAVFDREAINSGASSRNAGGVSGGVNLGGHSKRLRAGDVELAAALRTEAVQSYDHLRETIERESIDCAFRHNGRFIGAHSPAAFDELKRKADDMNSGGEVEVDILTRGEVGTEIGSGTFHGGMLVRRSGVVDPARYACGLAKAAERHGAMLFGETEVTGWDRVPGSGYRVSTAACPVNCREVVIATNGYTSSLTPWHRRRLVPLASYMVATEPLGTEVVSSLLKRTRFYADTWRLLHYFRPSPDGERILFGGRASFLSNDLRRACAILHGHLLYIFPQLAGTRISHGWTGNVAFSFDRLPHVGVRDNVHYALGCNGSGVTMLSYLGYRVATRISGSETAPTAFARQTFPTMPFYDGRPWFLPVVGSWFRMRDRIDLIRTGRMPAVAEAPLPDKAKATQGSQPAE